MKAKFKVRQDLAYWSSPAGTFVPGEEHEVDGSKDMMDAIAAAEAAGSIVEVSFDGYTSSVQSQKDGEKSLAAAMESGAWREGNLMQHEIDISAEAGVVVGDEA